MTDKTQTKDKTDYGKYFIAEEFACKCGCGAKGAPQELVDVLTDVREHFDRPLIVTSGVRCVKHNTRVGGAKKSKHVEGIAADIAVLRVPPTEVHEYLTKKYPSKYGIGKYSTFTHIDVRPTKARW